MVICDIIIPCAVHRMFPATPIKMDVKINTGVTRYLKEEEEEEEEEEGGLLPSVYADYSTVYMYLLIHVAVSRGLFALS